MFILFSFIKASFKRNKLIIIIIISLWKWQRGDIKTTTSTTTSATTSTTSTTSTTNTTTTTTTTTITTTTTTTSTSSTLFCPLVSFFYFPVLPKQLSSLRQPNKSVSKLKTKIDRICSVPSWNYFVVFGKNFSKKSKIIFSGISDLKLNDFNSECWL